MLPRDTPRSTPEEQGVSSSAILSFLEYIEHNVSELHSLMLLRHGSVIAEGWWAPYAPRFPHMLFSLSKSFTSTAIGLAVAEGRLTVDDPVLSFFPRQAPGAPEANLRAMRVRHLLAMSTGHDQDTTARVFPQRDWVQAFLALPVEHAPGTHFSYNTAATYMLSAILQQVTGEKLLDYLRPRLLQPLGISGAKWDRCPQGINVGGSGLRVTTEAIARFGQLYLNNGVWHGKRILSEEWIAQATARQVANGDNPESDWNQGYGYQFWRCRHGCYRGDGAFGQYCLVMPEQDAVLAITAGLGDMQEILTQVWDGLLPAMAATPRQPDPVTQATLAARLAALRFAPPAGESTSPLAARVSGRQLRFAPNEWKISSAAMDYTHDSATIHLQMGRRKYSILCGLGVWQYSKSALFNKKPEKVAASGVWTTPDTFQITLRYYETPFCWTIDCHYTDDGASLQAIGNVGFGPRESPVLEGTFS